MVTLASNGKRIDYYDNLDSMAPLFHVDPAPFFGQQVSPASIKTYTDTAFTVSLDLANGLFAGSYLLINLPA